MNQNIPFLLGLLMLLSLGACGGAGSLGGPVTGGQQSPPPASTGMSALELQRATNALSLVNGHRANFGLAPLSWDPGAACIAFEHSLDMDVRAFFSHTNPSGQGPGQRLLAAGIGSSTHGENIYWQMPPATAGQAVGGWMTSPPHRANILNPAFTQMGIGVHEAGGECWWTQLFLAP